MGAQPIVHQEYTQPPIHQRINQKSLPLQKSLKSMNCIPTDSVMTRSTKK